MTDTPPVGPFRLHGLSLSYFTGKLEAYLRAKGVAYNFLEMDTAAFRACARATGIAQMPQLECADGRWLTDTTAIIATFERNLPSPALSPDQPLTRFLSRVLEDYFDEWLWRPALYYRWAFKEDATLMSRVLARTMLRDLPLPLWLRQQFILHRQRRVYLSEDAVTRATAPAIERLYLEMLAALEAIFARRPFLFGERPCEADFGLFGPVFRHFSSDPTPAAIMRERAPRVLLWAARLWSLTPADLEHAPLLSTAPEDLYPLLARAGAEYIPYLIANAEAVGAGARHATYVQDGLTWRPRASPYRAACLASLGAEFARLSPQDQAAAASRLGVSPAVFDPAPGLASSGISRPLPGSRVMDRSWRS